MDVLTSRLASGEEALQVFSFEEEARMFLELGAMGGDWRVRVTSPGELISVLFCLCASVKRVALDSLPHPDGAALNHLMSMEREAFSDPERTAALNQVLVGDRMTQEVITAHPLDPIDHSCLVAANGPCPARRNHSPAPRSFVLQSSLASSS
jgi:hypothetical protein